eukprot:SAG11_NODE_1428_length_4941_cov_2.727385_2_plen_138_part_00
MLAELDFPIDGICTVSHPNDRAREALGVARELTWPNVQQSSLERYVDWWISCGFLPQPPESGGEQQQARGDLRGVFGCMACCKAEDDGLAPPEFVDISREEPTTTPEAEDEETRYTAMLNAAIRADQTEERVQLRNR